jgi:hypothetical protein
MMRAFAADDSDTIRKNILRSRVIQRADNACLAPDTYIPKEMFIAVGYTEEEYARIPYAQQKLPIAETALR